MFEFDPGKSAANKRKHGIDFDEAQALWTDEFAITASARSDVEARFLVVGAWQQKLWSAICTKRGDAIRIISVRRARDSEVKAYERAKDDWA